MFAANELYAELVALHIAKGRENYWLEKACMVVATRGGLTTNFGIVLSKVRIACYT